MNTKHTPGPWRVERTSMGTYVLSGNFCVATTADSRTSNVPPSSDNARLIAAAPELLAALRDLYARACRTEPDHQGLRHKSLDAARAAIANATKE